MAVIQKLLESIQKNHQEPLKIMLFLMFMGCLAICLFASKASPWSSFSTIVGISGLIAGSAFAIGSFIGFIFAIPKQSKKSDSNLKGPIRSYIGNDNLIEVSDWLTKIIVGVGLTQLTSIPQYLASIGEYAGKTLGGTETGTVGAATIIVYFFICGFMFVYLWTRIYFARILEKAELEESANKLHKEEDRLSKVESDLQVQKELLNAISTKLDELKSS